jgi:hypothetical protein
MSTSRIKHEICGLACFRRLLSTFKGQNILQYLRLLVGRDIENESVHVTGLSLITLFEVAIRMCRILSPICISARGRGFHFPLTEILHST